MYYSEVSKKMGRDILMVYISFPLINHLLLTLCNCEDFGDISKL